MATETTESATPTRQQVAGMDSLELSSQPGRTAGRAATALWRAVWPKALALALVVGAWQLVVLSNWRPQYALPPPERVFRDLAGYVPTAEFWTAVSITMQRALVGFALAVLIGTTIGVAVSRFRLLRTAIGSMVTGMLTMPSITWFPFAILLFGFTETTIIFVVILGAAPSVANGLISGIDYVPATWRRVGQVLGMRGFTLYRHLILPASLPSFVSGLKQGWAFAWRSLMAGELLVVIAGQGSIGALMQFARELNNATRLIAWIITVLTIGVLVDVAFRTADQALRRRWGLAGE